MSSPLETYSRLYLHVLKLAGRAILRRWLYLFLAPAIAIPVSVIMEAVGGVGAANVASGFVGDFVNGLIIGAAVSAVLFVGRAIIEQRRLRFDDVLSGFAEFLNDVLTVMFVFWIASIVLRAVRFLLFVLLLVPVVLPLFETVALSAVGGYAVFEAAWRFLRRDAGPWLVGHIPLLMLIPIWLIGMVGINIALDFVPRHFVGWLGEFLHTSLELVLLLVAFIYRGILFLTLDNASPRARAEKFGGEAGLR